MLRATLTVQPNALQADAKTSADEYVGRKIQFAGKDNCR